MRLGGLRPGLERGAPAGLKVLVHEIAQDAGEGGTADHGHHLHASALLLQRQWDTEKDSTGLNGRAGLLWCAMGPAGEEIQSHC